MEAVRWFDRHIDLACLRRLACRYVDGVIANSELSAQSMRRLAPELPIRVVEPYIQPSVYDRLQSVEPSLDDPTAVFVGKAREHKGLDLLVEAWPEVRRRIPGATLELIGRDHTTAHGRVEGVTVRGYVDQLDEVFEAASLYVQPARYEPWGVAPVEAMLAGVPPIVTDRTGIASLVARIDERLVVSPTPDELAETVTWYFDLQDELKRRFSARARELARPYDERTQTRAFVEEFGRLLESIG
jgi:glycosyltransferase involved in cell wall biosynthesis